LESGNGPLACGESGEGRMLEPEDILREIKFHLNQSETSSRRLKVLVTSGGTREPIDGVRSIANTSTGQTGTAIARYFALRGHEVTLVRARDSVPAPRLNGLHARDFSTFSDLQNSLKEELGNTPYDAVIHAAAVSDFSLDHIEVNGHAIPPSAKIDSDAAGVLNLFLKRNPKLVNELRSYSRNESIRIVAFKLTNTRDEAERLKAVQKLAKNAKPDFVFQNDLSEIDPARGLHVARIYSANEPEDPKLLFEGRSKDDAVKALEKLLLGEELNSAGGNQWS